MATQQKEVVTPGVPGEAVHTPTNQYHADHPDSAFHIDVAAGSKEGTKEELEGEPRRKKFLWWRLTKKQFILAIIGSVLLFLAILIVILWFTAVKAIFQSNVNKVEMTVNYLDIKAIPSNEVLTGEMSLRLKHDLHMNARTDATTAHLLYGGQEFGWLEFPALKISKGEQDYNLTINGDVTITDAAVFETMSTDVMELTEVVLTASAEVKAHALGLSYGGLDFTRELTFSGLNNFRDPLTVIDHIDFWGCTDEEFTMDIDVNVTNVAQMGLDGIGFLNLTLYVDELYLGYLEGRTPEVGVPRGVSTETFRLHVPADSTSMPVMVTNLVNKHVQYYITGESEYATEHTLFKQALEHMNMSIIYTEAMARIDLNTSCALIVLPMAS